MSQHVTHHGHTPDLLNDLHTLRSLAHSVKSQADNQRLWGIAAICATISEEATICIEKINGGSLTKQNTHEQEITTSGSGN